jgi:hypothetical protein
MTTDQPFDQPPRLPPSINIRVEYRQLGPGPESIEVQWDAGAHTPSAADICAVIRQLWDPPRAWSASSRIYPGEVAGS